MCITKLVSMSDVEQHSNDSNGDDSVEADRHNESILHFCVQFDEVLQCMKRTNEIDADIPKDILKRKEARYKRLIEYRRLKRKDERRRRRQRKANVDVECFRLDFELNVIVDLAFTDAMNGKELGKLVRQMGRVWGIQKRYIGLKTTLLSPCKKFLEESRRVLTGFDSFQWNISFSDVQECCSKPLVYLSPDASLPPLEDISSSMAYVIGGLVDESGVGSLSKHRAESLDIEVRRFPIVEYMKRANRGTFNVMLTINQVVEVLARYAYCRRWDQAFVAVIPKRSGYVLKGT